VLALFHQVHDQLRKEISGLDSDALNWAPIVGSNSVATIITHVVGSEDETFRSMAALPSVRDRDAEFAGSGLTTAEALALLDGADELITTVKPHIDSDRLNSVFALPTLPAEELRSGFTWLVGNYGHACEHLGQIQLTRQLYQDERSSHS
jgi:DinB superfamily